MIGKVILGPATLWVVETGGLKSFAMLVTIRLYRRRARLEIAYMEEYGFHLWIVGCR